MANLARRIATHLPNLGRDIVRNISTRRVIRIRIVVCLRRIAEEIEVRTLRWATIQTLQLSELAWEYSRATGLVCPAQANVDRITILIDQFVEEYAKDWATAFLNETENGLLRDASMSFRNSIKREALDGERTMKTTRIHT